MKYKGPMRYTLLKWMKSIQEKRRKKINLFERPCGGKTKGEVKVKGREQTKEKRFGGNKKKRRE